MILDDRQKEESVEKRGGPPLTWKELVKLPQTWGIIAARTMTDPIWFFITDWFAIYLVTKGINPEQSLLAFWIPFVAADLGNFFGGGVSSWLIRRGWPVLRARKAVVAVGLAHDEQEVDAVPHLDYDQRLDWVLCPSGPIKCES